ncbi:golgin subfamily A member 6-like protein 22 [Dendronephthya gigantea]|uniref:golgin subfamily A member 6-like protein 22 n=1 Tax=Dendronephthya gigantea TaxID=151771 RepID=UPI0010696AD5|nr:golgin subfamily A member 6-like protein 22 [Dendronephthya gigantea]
MSGDGVQSKSLDPHNLNLDDLRRITQALQHQELKGKNNRSMNEVKETTRILSESEKKMRRKEKTRAENSQIALRRAEARIAILNKKLGIGPQTAFEIDVVNPRVSQKDYDSLTIEYIKLKEALEHIVPTELGGKDVVLKNQELYEMVTKLQEEITACNNHIRELEATLAGNDNELALKVSDQTKKIMKLERSMIAKEIFSEKLMKENKNLLNHLEKMKNQEFMKEQDVPDGQASGNKMNAKEEQEKMLALLEEKEKMISESGTKIQELVAEIDNLVKQVQELTIGLGQANEVKTKLESDISETTKKCSDYQTKCNNFFKQVLSLNRKQQDYEEEISELKQEVESLRAQVAEKDAMMLMMRKSLKPYEAGFKSENEEKAKIQKRLNESNQESERLRRENQSHMATVRHFESEIERMNKLLNEKNKSNSSIGLPFGPLFGSSAPRSFFHDSTKENSELLIKLEKIEAEKEKEVQELKNKLAKMSNLETKCNRFYVQISGLNKEIQDCKEEISVLKHKNEDLCAELTEAWAIVDMMRGIQRKYKADFKSENEEKEKIQKQLDELKQECERLRRENQSHMATVRHFENEVRNPAPIVVADGGDHGGVNESTGGTRQTNASINPPKASPTLIECLCCSRSYTYYQFSSHVNECMKE